jgi:hypothetical protein
MIYSVSAQDLIVTHGNDSIEGKITRMSIDTLFYSINEVSKWMPMSFVKSCQIGFFQMNENLAMKPKEKSRDYQKIRFALNGGYSYRVGKVPDGLDAERRDYIRKLKSGFHVGTDLSFYFNKKFGLRAKGIFSRASNSMEASITDLDGNFFSTIMSDQITISFIGPMLSMRLLDNTIHDHFMLNVSLGYMGYTNNVVLAYPYKLKGKTAGFLLDIGYDRTLTKNFAIGLQLSLIAGILTKYTLKSGSYWETVKLSQNSYESLIRIDASIGIRFGK